MRILRHRACSCHHAPARRHVAVSLAPCDRRRPPAARTSAVESASRPTIAPAGRRASRGPARLAWLLAWGAVVLAAWFGLAWWVDPVLPAAAGRWIVVAWASWLAASLLAFALSGSSGEREVLSGDGGPR